MIISWWIILLLAIIGVVNVSMAFVGVGYWFGPDSVGLDWERYEE